MMEPIQAMPMFILSHVASVDMLDGNTSFVKICSLPAFIARMSSIFFGAGLHEAAQHCDYRDYDGNQHRHEHDGFLTRARPHDYNGPQRYFRQAVQHHDVGLQNFADAS